jgi:hypothetical protein
MDLNMEVLDMLWDGSVLLDNWNIMNNPADTDLWLDLSQLWGDLSVGADWSKDPLLGHEWLEITSLGSTDSGNLEGLGDNYG